MSFTEQIGRSLKKERVGGGEQSWDNWSSGSICWTLVRGKGKIAQDHLEERGHKKENWIVEVTGRAAGEPVVLPSALQGEFKHHVADFQCWLRAKICLCL